METTSKKRRRSKKSKGDQKELKNVESSDDETPQTSKKSKKRKVSKSIEEEIEGRSPKITKTKRKLEQMLKEAEKVEAEKKGSIEMDESIMEESLEGERNDDEILLKIPWKMDIYGHNDLVAVVIDEISLEGLDGITLEALWTRLSITMSFNIPESFRNRIWDIIVNYEKLDFFELPEPRGKLVIFNRFQHVDPISGHISDVDEIPQDIYPFVPLSDEASTQLDIYGSCANFTKRVKITEKIRKSTLQEAVSLGNKLVIVAHQSLRNECLGLNETKTLTKLFNQQYSLLERIGRSRRLGESSVGKTSLRQFADSKVMFYLRKVLLKNDLITKQQLCIKSNKPSGHVSSLLFHLKRFYFHYKSKKVLIIEQIVDTLKKKPNFRMEYVELKKIFGVEMWQNSVVKMLKGNELKQFTNTNVLVPYREVYPNAITEEWMHKNKKEKKLRMIQLIDPDVNISNFLKEFAKEETLKDDSSDEEPLCEGVFNKSAYEQVYNVIYESGSEGLTHAQVTLKLGLDVYVARMAIKSLEKENLVYSKNADLGCVRVLKFFATNYPRKNPQTPIIPENEDEDALDFISNVLEINKECLKLKTKPKQIEPKTENNSMKGKYEFIKEYHKQCREEKYNVRFRGNFYKVENLDEAKRKMEEILKNEHDFFDIRESIENKIVKKIDLNVDFNEVSFANYAEPDGFDLFKNYKVPKIKTTIDYNSMRLQLKDFFGGKFKKIFIQKSHNRKSIKIVIDYLKISPNNLLNIPLDISIEVLMKKFDEIVSLIKEQKINKNIEFPINPDDSDEDDCADQISLIQNFEGESLGKIELSDEIKRFKEDILNNFDGETHRFSKHLRFKDEFPIIQSEEIQETDDVKHIEIIESSTQEVSLKNLFENDHSTKEFTRSFFNNLVGDFQIEAFFGENILVDYSPLDSDGIETITIFSKNKNVVIDHGKKYINRNLSQRALDRANYILDVLYKDKVVSDLSRILSSLKKFELNKGLVGTIDKKSMNRLMEKMINEGYFIAVKVVLKHGNSIRTRHIVALPYSDYKPILNAVKEQMKMSFFIYSRRKQSLNEAEKSNQEEISTKIQEIEVGINGTPKFKCNKFIGKYYGYLPKNSRHKLLHEFLFYLVYGYDGKLIEKSNLPTYMKENNLEEYPLYRHEISWKMFIPPVSEYKNYPPGWILYCDILLRIPISIFVKIFNVVYVMPELVHHLNDPIKKYLLLQYVPPKIRNACLFKRKYIFSIYEGLQHLCYQGLLQFGEQKIRTKDQQFLYLNKKAIIYDTTSSNPGYHQTTEKEYPMLRFEFQTEEDVENYWSKVWNICSKTRLGLRYSLLNQTITLQNIHGIPEMVEAAQPRSRESAMENDVGYLPGDGRGACGFDSNSWMFVRRNWVRHQFGKNEGKFDSSGSRPIGVRKKQLDKVKSKTIKLKDLQKDALVKKKKKKIVGNPPLLTDSLISVNNTKKIAGHKPFTRKIHPRPMNKKKIKRIDELDKSIKKSGLLRSRFTQNEDDMLTIIGYAIKYLFPAYKKRLISFIVIRDLMHRLCPQNYKKTSTAYNGRLSKNLKNPQVESAINLDADRFVQKHFSLFKEKILSKETIPQEHLHIALVYLVAYCVDSFEKNATKNKKILDEVGYVDHLENDCFKEENLEIIGNNSLYNDPSTKEEVLIDTVKSVIHSSIGLEVDNTIKIILDHLDRTYQVYSEEILRKSVLNLREHNLIKTSIGHNRKPKRNKPENILQSSYLYSYKQVTKFNEKIYLESFSILKKFEDSPTLQKFNLNVYQEGFGLGFSELQTEIKIEIFIKIPDKQFILYPNTRNHDHLIKELNSRYKRLISKKSIRENENENEIVSESKERIEIDKEDTLKDLEDLSKYIKDGDYDKINSKMSDLAFLLTKGLFPELEDEDDRLERSSRYFLTMVPETSFKINNAKIPFIKFSKIEEIKDFILKDCVFEIFQIYEDQGDKIVDFIKNKGIFGVGSSELKANFSKEDLKVISRLLDKKIIFRFGVKTFKFVHRQFIDDWVVICQKDEDGFQTMKLKPVPWLKINGEINEKVLLDWLFSIQSYCVSNPLVGFPALCKRFNFLKPVDIYLLLEYLQLVGCLKLKCYEEIEEVSLFSQPKEIEWRQSDFLDNLDDVFVEVNRLAILKLGGFSRGDQELLSPFEES